MAAEVLAFRENWLDVAASGLSSTRHLTKAIGWDEESELQRRASALRASLEYIAESWVDLCARRKVGAILQPVIRNSYSSMIFHGIFFSCFHVE